MIATWPVVAAALLGCASSPGGSGPSRHPSNAGPGRASPTTPAPSSDAAPGTQTRPWSNPAALASDIDWLIDAAAARGSIATRLEIGHSDAGVRLQAVHFTRSGGPDKRPVVLLIGPQRADETHSAQALIALLRQLASGDLAQVLDRVDVLAVPRLAAAADPSSRGVNDSIVADHLLLRTSQARALAAQVRAWDPAVIIALDELPGSSARSVEWQASDSAGVEPFIARAAREWFRDPIAARWMRDTSPQPQPGPSAVSLGSMLQVGGLGNAVTLRLAARPDATREMAPGMLADALRLAAERAADLAKLRRYVRNDVASRACRGDIQLDGGRTLPRPCGYWLAADEAEAAERLRQLGLDVKQLVRPIEALGSFYQPGDTQSRLLDALVDMPQGSYYVSTSQALANLAVTALEPDSPAGYFRQGLITRLDHLARLRVPVDVDGPQRETPETGESPQVPDAAAAPAPASAR